MIDKKRQIIEEESRKIERKRALEKAK